MLGSGAARSCQQPGLALALARGDYVEIGERGGELAGGDPEGPRGGADLAQRGDRQCLASDLSGRQDQGTGICPSPQLVTVSICGIRRTDTQGF